MSHTHNWRRALTSAAAFGLLLTTATLIDAAPASAAPSSTTFKAKICADGSYSAYLVFPNRGGFATRVVAPKHCTSVTLGDLPAPPEQLMVVAVSGSKTRVLHRGWINDTNFTVRTSGTFRSPRWRLTG